MDALSEALRSIRLTGAAFIEAELKAPWSFQTPPPRAIADVLMPDADHVVPYHLVTRGHCSARLPDGVPVDLAAGDVVMFPRGEQHVLCDARVPGPDTVVLGDARRLLSRGKVTPVRAGGTGELTGLVCGFFACDRRLSAPILAGLPRVLRVSLDDGADTHWLHSTVRFSVVQTALRRPGSATVLSKLSELLFVETVRRYIEQVPEGQTGWLAGLRDAHVAKALALLHARPQHPWTVETLSREVALSRSAFAERFSHFLGQPPMQYLAQWRLGLAARRLHDGRESVARIAETVGYDSEASFARAFKREFGRPPAAWRRKEERREPEAK